MTLAAILAKHTGSNCPQVDQPRGQHGDAGTVAAQRVPVVPNVPTQERRNKMKAYLHVRAEKMGLPRKVVDSISELDLEACTEQIAIAADHRDTNGDPLAKSLLTFYLRELADKVDA